MKNTTADGIHGMVPREKMTASARKLRDTYAIAPGIPLFRREFGFFTMERWKKEGMPQDVPYATLFQLDPPGDHGLGALGWCEAAFAPAFEECTLEDRGECEVVRDAAGRHVLFFKERRSGFMPEYLVHPVRDRKTWEENVKWRLDPLTPGRYADLEQRLQKARAAAGQGLMISQNVIGGGIDKRLIAQGPPAIDRHLEAILPAMRKRGGYIPTCDHGVPEETSYNNYLHYRKRCVELGG